MEALEIIYDIHIEGQEPTRFEIRMDPESLLLKQDTEPQDLPEWTDLDYCKCPHCPLSKEDFPHCPPAANLVSVVKGFEQIYAYEEVHVVVTTAERTISADTTTQRAVGSLMGLVMATSACPHLTFFRPMARYHLPFSSGDETVFRATSTYLLTQYFRRMAGEEPDFDLNGLVGVYERVQDVNYAFADRIRMAAKADTAANALVALDVLAQTLPMAVEDQLEELRWLFAPFLQAESDATKDA